MTPPVVTASRVEQEHVVSVILGQGECQATKISRRALAPVRCWWEGNAWVRTRLAWQRDRTLARAG